MATVRRVFGVGAMVLGAALALTACPAPPPDGWVAPVVSVTVTPESVEAGGTFDVEVEATSRDQTPIAMIEIDVHPPYNPSSSSGLDGVTCEAGELTPAATATRSFTCTLPQVVPNGTWSVRATAATGGAIGYGGAADAFFAVTGGYDDHAAPVRDSFTVSPDPVVIGEPFSVTVRTSDETPGDPPAATLSANIVLPAPPEGPVSWSCSPADPTPISDTVLEWHFADCLIPAGSSPWAYAGGFEVADAYGHSARVSVQFQAVVP